MSKSLRLVFLIFLCFTLFSGIAFAQSRESAVLQGKVVDNEGAPLPGVTIVSYLHST